MRRADSGWLRFLPGLQQNAGGRCPDLYAPRRCARAAEKQQAPRPCRCPVCGGSCRRRSDALAALPGKHARKKPPREFRAALADGDFARLCAVAEPSGETAFTEESLAPMFSLYRESAAFRQQAAELASTDSACLHVEKARRLPVCNLPVCALTPCRLNVTTNVAGASVSAGDEQTASVATELSEALDGAGYTQDALNLVRSEAAFDTLLPGFTTWRCLIPPHSGRALMQPIPSAFSSLRRSRSTSTTQVCTSGTVRACAWICPSTALTAQRLPRVHLCSLPCCTPTPSSPPAAQPTQAKRSPAASPAASRSFEVLFSLGTVDVYNDY